MNHSDSFNQSGDAVLPNLFLVGAPKCGTTALHSYLLMHPQIQSCDRKEFFYFDTDHSATSPYAVREREKYLDYFKCSSARYAIDASTWYLFSEVAAANIKAFNPDAKIIIMLRKPVDMIYSLHGQRLYTGNEDIADFQTALCAEPDRATGRRIPPNAQIPEGLQYRKVGLYYQQVKRYLDLFPRKQVLILLYDEFSKDTAGTYASVLRFLEIDDIQLPAFDRINAHKVSRSPTVNMFLGNYHHPLRRLVRAALPFGDVRKKVARQMKKWNTKETRRSALDPALAGSLAEYFCEDVTRLQGLIGRDLTHWLPPAPAGRTAV